MWNIFLWMNIYRNYFASGAVPVHCAWRMLGHLFDVVQALTRDSVTVTVDAVVYYRVNEPLKAVVSVNDYR